MEKKDGVVIDQVEQVSETEVDCLVEELDTMLANFAKHQVEKTC
ncbi:hypothetical protein [Streptococcus suis]|nr:hypothetical protein [Streptococcus suis]